MLVTPNGTILSVLVDEPAIKAPELRLLFAVLNRALVDYIYGFEEECGFNEGRVENWFFGNESHSDAMSFSWICEHLELDASCLREAIKRFKSAIECKLQ